MKIGYRLAPLAPTARRLAAGCALLGALWAAPHPGWAQSPQLDLPRVRLSAGMFLIQAQVASTPAQRNTGLMWRRKLPPHEGMLFVFEAPASVCFWMRNTYLPLSAAFVGDDGTIVHIAQMQPLSEATHCTPVPVRYVLEMNQGWFANRGVGPGDKLSGRPFKK
jgi:uncharacterized membrane protein (UPF0127 family)